MINSYEMGDVMEVAKASSLIITKYLESLPHTVGVINVEDDKNYQEEDVDLLWKVNLNKEFNEIKIEIKADRYLTQNFFFETVSNVQRNTLGCFLSTQSDYLAYHFINENLVYFLPTEQVREWFLENQNKFEKKYTSTNVGNDMYVSVGYIVPRWFLERKLKIKPITLK